MYARGLGDPRRQARETEDKTQLRENNRRPANHRSGWVPSGFSLKLVAAEKAAREGSLAAAGVAEMPPVFPVVFEMGGICYG